MADKSIGELIAAERVQPTDLFVLQQDNTAKKLTGQVLENWLVSLADGHGGIQSIEKQETSGLKDTYRITLADTTTFDFVVTNGKGITAISKTSTSGLVDTYTIRYNDSTKSTFTVTNGAKGDKGDAWYVHIKYASQKPTESSHSFGDVPDNWIGIYSGTSAIAPGDWKQYQWFEIKGEKGNTGDPALLTSSKVEYQSGTSGTVPPSGVWSESVPTIPQGQYLWTRLTVRFNSGQPIQTYSVGRMGVDGLGSVVSVNTKSPDGSGNVSLTAADVGALSTDGGTMDGELNMNGQRLKGIIDPTEADHAVPKNYADNTYAKKTDIPSDYVHKSGDEMTGPLTVPTPTEGGHAARKDYVDAKYLSATLAVSGWSGSGPYTQTVTVEGVVAEKAPRITPVYSGSASEDSALKEASAAVSYAKPGNGSVTFTCLEDKPGVDIPIQVEVRP